MEEPYTWDYFDDGHRPPTVYELAQELMEKTNAVAIREISHSMHITNCHEEVVVIQFSYPSEMENSFIYGTEFVFIGASGPAYIRFGCTERTRDQRYTYITLKGNVYYK